MKNFITTNNQAKRTLVILFSFAFVGVYMLTRSQASTSSASFEIETGNKSPNNVAVQVNNLSSGGSNIKFSSVKRFFADDASWNRPVSEFGESTTLAPYADRFWNYAGLPSTDLGGTNVDFRDYSVPIYDVSESNKTVRIFQVKWAQNIQSFSTTGVAIGSTVPWNDSWIPGTGDDRIMHFFDYTTGENHGFWVVGEPKDQCDDRSLLPLFFPDGPNTQAGYNPYDPNHLCMAAAGKTSGIYSVKDGTTNNERGMGIDKLALVTRAKEVNSGAIRHALELTITSTMFGAPVCANNDYSVPGAGVDCGFYLKPSTRVEFATNENNRIGTRCNRNGGNQGYQIEVNSTERAKTVPEGMRIALRLSDNDIETWLNNRGYTGKKRDTARIFAVALRDYGAIVAETGCYGIGIETDGLQNPTTRNEWAAAGITDDGSANPHGNLLQGLITRQRLYIVNPPN